MKVAIIGSRTAYNLNFDFVSNFLPDECDEIVSGGSGAVDGLAEKIAKSKNLKFKCFLPDYGQYGKMAPLIRNLKIIEYSDMVLAFWNKTSKGTKFVIKESIKKGVPVRTIYVDY